MFKLEHGIPVSVECLCAERPVRYYYPFKEMKVGDSFKFPLADRYRVTASAHAPGVKKTFPQAKFVSRKIDNNTCRIWRVA